MATYKRIDGNYTIASVDPSAGDNVNIITHTLNLTGNLDVTGNVTYINVNDLTVDDPFITVAGNNAGVIANATFQQQGLVAQTSSNTFAGIRFDNGNLAWQVSPSVDANGAPIVAYANLTTGATTSPGGSNTFVQFNDSGTFGGNSALAFDKVTGKLTIQGHVALGNIGATPSSVANSVVMYNNTVGAGGTGLYVVSSSVNDELVSKSKAIVFAIIF
jgi:hypothetical protein